MLPNNFPRSARRDARLQHGRRHAVVRAGRPRLRRGDRRRSAWSTSCLPALRDDRRLARARHALRHQVDPADGLLRAGEPGVQLTWMDAKVGDWVVTPRIGKPVEIQALWYNALRSIAGCCGASASSRRRYDGRWPSRRAPASAPAS